MIIGMDVGGTTARIRVMDEGGCCWEGEDQGGTLAGIGREELSARLGRIVRRALAASGTRAEDCRSFCLGASGVDTEEARKTYEEILISLGFSGACLLVINDAELLVRMFETPAVVLISGTGSIAIGSRGTGGALVRCGGWEHLLSDEGSATWLGLETLRAYVRLSDGRGSDPLFMRLVGEATGCRTAQDAVDFCQEHILEKADIAALAPLLDRGAREGSEVCHRILERGAEELIGLVTPLVSRVAPEGSFTLLLWGSVLLRNRELQHLTARMAKSMWPGITVCVPECTALDCAVLLARGEKSMPVRRIDA